ncbi:hypothetical protein E2562_017335, partial [Oryza meyeriana var. granulata]
MELHSKKIVEMISELTTVLGSSNAAGSSKFVANPPNADETTRLVEEPVIDIEIIQPFVQQPATDVAGPSKQSSGGSDIVGAN